MLTRSVGAHIGTKIGFSFALGNNIGSSMYILGSMEMLMYLFDIKFADEDINTLRILGVILWVFLICILLIGIKYVSRFAFITLSCLIIGLLSR